jgi:DNA-binding CsgD family transcriptional regulator
LQWCCPPAIIGRVATLALHARESELASLDGLIATAGDGGGVLVVRGEAGIGKSTLLTAARCKADAAGMVVLSAAGVQSESHLPFAGLHQLLQPLLGDLDALPGPHRVAIEVAFGMTDGAAPNPFLIALATLELLGEAAARSPLLVVAEDAHWLDHPTSDVLAFVARRVNLEPIVLLFAVRDDGENPFETAGLPEMRLEPLDRPSAADLLDAHAPELTPAVRERLLDEAAGNPLALVELPLALESQLDETSVLPDHLPLSDRLERAFAARLPELPEVTRTLLLAAAADGHSVVDETIGATERVLGRSVAADALDPATELRLVNLEQPGVRFRHPLVRSAVYRAATVCERNAIHSALADMLTGDPDRSVWHRAAAAGAVDEALAADLEATAQRAQRRGATTVAVLALRRAAELSDAQERVRRLLLAAELAFELGRRDIALPLLAAAEPLDLTPLQRGRMAWVREVIDPRPLDSAKVRFLVETAERAAEEGDRDLALDLLWLVASRCWWSFLGEEQRLAGLAAAEALGSLEDDPRVLSIVAYLAPLERGEAVIAALARASGRSDGDAESRGLLATAAFVTGEFDLAETLLAGSAARLRSQGLLGHLPRLLALQGTVAARRPDWNIAIPAAEEGVRLASELGQPAWVTGAQTAEAYVAALRGDEAAAEAAAAEAERVALPIGANFLLTAVQWARGLAALGAGRHADAYAELARTHDPQDPSFHNHMRWWAIADIAEAAAHSGNAEEVRGLLDELAPLAERTPASWIQLGLRHARAVLAEDVEAQALYQAALGAKVNRWPYQRARVLLAYGAWLRRQRRVAESRTPLRAARDAFDALGVRAWGERARQELRASGETSRNRTPEARDQLTPQELQIAQMAAEGLTNREIGQQLYLSHRTVGSHLYRLFPKLGITSRGQLSTVLTAD